MGDHGIDLDSVDDVLGGEDGDAPGLDADLDVLEHEHLDLVLDPHEGGDQAVPGALRPPMDQIVSEVTGQWRHQAQVQGSGLGGSTRGRGRGRGRGILITRGVDKTDAQKQLKIKMNE